MFQSPIHRVWVSNDNAWIAIDGENKFQSPIHRVWVSKENRRCDMTEELTEFQSPIHRVWVSKENPHYCYYNNPHVFQSPIHRVWVSKGSQTTQRRPVGKVSIPYSSGLGF